MKLASHPLFAKPIGKAGTRSTVWVGGTWWDTWFLVSMVIVAAAVVVVLVVVIVNRLPPDPVGRLAGVVVGGGCVLR